MKRGLIYVFVILIALIFIVSACEQYVGGKVNNRRVEDREVAILTENIIFYVGTDAEQGVSAEFLHLDFKDKAGNDVRRVNLFGWHWLDVGRGEISAPPYGRMLVGDHQIDEPFIIKEGMDGTIYPRFYLENDLSGVKTTFLYYKNGYSYIIRISSIGTQNRYDENGNPDNGENYIRFYVKNTNEFFDETYNNGEITEYDLNGLLPSPFRLIVKRTGEGNHAIIESISFVDINDEEDKISKIETFGGAIVRLDYNTQLPENLWENDMNHDPLSRELTERITYEKIFFKERNGKEIGAIINWEPFSRTLEISSLISDGNSDFEVHPIEQYLGANVKFEGTTKSGTGIKWTKLNGHVLSGGNPFEHIQYKLEFNHHYPINFRG